MMGSKVKFSCIFLLIFLIGCNTKERVFGIYSSNNFGRIELGTDSTFKLRGGYLENIYFSEGTWRHFKNKSVLLNSTITNTTAQLFLIAKKSERIVEPKVKITPYIVGTDSLADFRCQIYLDNEKYASIRCDSLNVLSVNKPFEKLFVEIVFEPLISYSTAISSPIASEVINVGNSDASFMEFCLFIEKNKFFYKSFNSYLLNMKNGKLYFMNEYSGEWELLKKIKAL